ncbi:hypothetical protein [Nostoc favosum]|uniref:Replication protein n=1 Tax=Nostoc favosum CHAB5714 TaxID=2780399 RepID=A0ABS8I8U5_9NOSO|nr:hypothetical protein [Nostoc favosum]MCC5600605.1 hypothetical protein [Nostoc favosum CHAB5714]
MSRIKRWINMNRKEFNPDGTLKPEAREQMLSRGMNNAAIDSYARRCKAEYDEWKRLDETDPEEWIEYTAYDFLSSEEKKQFNPDGTLRAEYIESALKQGISEGWLAEMERRQKIEIENFNKMSASHAEQGINYGAWLMRSLKPANGTYKQRLQQMEVDLRNNEEPSSLPFDKDTPYL